MLVYDTVETYFKTTTTTSPHPQKKGQPPPPPRNWNDLVLKMTLISRVSFDQLILTSDPPL